MHRVRNINLLPWLLCWGIQGLQLYPFYFFFKSWRKYSKMLFLIKFYVLCMPEIFHTLKKYAISTIIEDMIKEVLSFHFSGLISWNNCEQSENI